MYIEVTDTLRAGPAPSVPMTKSHHSRQKRCSTLGCHAHGFGLHVWCYFEPTESRILQEGCLAFSQTFVLVMYESTLPKRVFRLLLYEMPAFDLVQAQKVSMGLDLSSPDFQVGSNKTRLRTKCAFQRVLKFISVAKNISSLRKKFPPLRIQAIFPKKDFPMSFKFSVHMRERRQLLNAAIS